MHNLFIGNPEYKPAGLWLPSIHFLWTGDKLNQSQSLTRSNRYRGAERLGRRLAAGPVVLFIPHLLLPPTPNMWARNWLRASHKAHSSKCVHFSSPADRQKEKKCKKKKNPSFPVSVSWQKSNQRWVIIYSHAEEEWASTVWRRLIIFCGDAGGGARQRAAVLHWQVAGGYFIY